MSHARSLTIAAINDPIHAAIQRHRAAYDAFQVAPEGEASMHASDDYDAATDAVATTPCATRFGALALLTHLRWWIGEEAEFSAGHQPGYGIAQARVADLTLFLGTNLPPVSIPRAYPQGRMPSVSTRPLPVIDRLHRASDAAQPDEPLPGEGASWEAVAAVRPDTAFVRARRFMDAGAEFLAAITIIAGGVLAYGFLPIA